jgi:hypothetical protein
MCARAKSSYWFFTYFILDKGKDVTKQQDANMYSSTLFQGISGGIFNAYCWTHATFTLPYRQVCCIKWLVIFPSSAGMSLTKLPRESLISDIPAGGGTSLTFFYSVCTTNIQPKNRRNKEWLRVLFPEYFFT